MLHALGFKSPRVMLGAACHVAGDGADARYANSADAGRYLARQSPDYMGGHAILYNDRCAVWFDLGGKRDLQACTLHSFA